MALTSRDETDLLLPLFDGKVDGPPFAPFLERLRRRTAAFSASIELRSGPGREIRHFVAGADLRQRARSSGVDDWDLTDRILYDRLRPGRVYTPDEFDDHDPERKARRNRDMRRLGAADARMVRLLDESPLSAWLVVVSERPCTAADSALLSNLAPYAAAALRTFVAAEHDALITALNVRSLEGAGCGWIAFDRGARVLALAVMTADLLAQASGHAPVLGQRLRDLGLATDHALTDAAAAFTQSVDAADRAIVLSQTPRIEAVLSPARGSLASLAEAPAMIALCRQPQVPSRRAAARLAQLHDLPRREAELAMLLAQGRSLAAAGAIMGLTIETTRNYSKRLFAKMGVRGQADLVRAVYESCASLA